VQSGRKIQRPRSVEVSANEQSNSIAHAEGKIRVLLSYLFLLWAWFLWFCCWIRDENKIDAGILANLTLTTLAIHSLNTDDGSKHRELCAAIGAHPTLKTVELRNVFEISLHDLLELVSARSLVTLRVVRCGLWQHNTEDAENVWTAVCDRIDDKQLLEELDLSSNVFTEV
jgi:hypothetical protein